jgi:hypothetical protein
MKVKVLSVMLFILLLSSLGFTRPAAVPAAGGDVERFKAELSKDGFDFQNGKLTPLSPADLFCAKVLPSCYGNNHDTPYLAYVLPPAPGQTTPNTFPWTYRLREDEAIVFVGKTPPPATYYSYRSYLAAHPVGKDAVPPVHRVYASLGDMVNNFTLQTPDPKNPFNQPIMLITAADKGVEVRIRSAAQRAGYSTRIMNSDIIPPNLANMGIEAGDDEFTFLHRIAFFKDEKQKEAYMQPDPVIVDGKLIQPPYEPNSRGVVLRITPQKGKEPKPDPYPVPPLRVRGTGDTNEFQYVPDLRSLRQSILDKYKGGSYQAQDLTTSVWITEGYDGIQRNLDVLGETRDTLYLRTDSIDLGKDDFLMLYGVVHALTGKATYSNFNIYTDDPVPDQLPWEVNILLGFLSANSEQSVESKEGLKGSALPWIKGQPNADKLYAWKIARDCKGEAFCLQIPEQPCERMTYNKIFAVFRLYIEPKTLVGPVPQEVLYDRGIYFKATK